MMLTAISQQDIHDVLTRAPGRRCCVRGAVRVAGGRQQTDDGQALAGVAGCAEGVLRQRAQREGGPDLRGPAAGGGRVRPAGRPGGARSRGEGPGRMNPAARCAAQRWWTPYPTRRPASAGGPRVWELCPCMPLSCLEGRRTRGRCPFRRDADCSVQGRSTVERCDVFAGATSSRRLRSAGLAPGSAVGRAAVSPLSGPVDVVLSCVRTLGRVTDSDREEGESA